MRGLSSWSGLLESILYAGFNSLNFQHANLMGTPVFALTVEFLAFGKILVLYFYFVSIFATLLLKWFY